MGGGVQLKHAVFKRAGGAWDFFTFRATAVGSFPAGRHSRINTEQNGPIGIQSTVRPVSIRPHCARLPARTVRGGQLGFIIVTVDNGEGGREGGIGEGRDWKREGKKKHRMGAEEGRRKKIHKSLCSGFY